MRNLYKIAFIAVLVAVFIASFLWAAFSPSGYLQGGDYESAVTFALAFGLLLWGISMIYRVQYKRQRNLIAALVLTFFFWIALRFVKWLPNIHYLSIYADYFYYVPMVIVPTVFFMLTVETFYPGLPKKRLVYALVLTFAYLLIALVLTNQLHFLVYRNYRFSYGDNPNVEIIHSEYGPLHYVALGLVGAIGLSSLIVFILGTRKQLSISMVAVTGSAFTLLLAYVVLFTTGVLSKTPFLRDFATCIAILLSLVLETLLRIGLIQNNGHYAKHFAKASLGVGIYDERGGLLYQTPSFVGVSSPRKETDSPLGRYHVVTRADISSIVALQDNIASEKSRIARANENLCELVALNEKEASLHHRLALIEEIDAQIDSTKGEILALTKGLPNRLDDSSKKTLGYISMLLGYMKQKCMLLLRAKDEANMTLEQAKLLFSVIGEDIKSGGYAEVATQIVSQRDIPVSTVASINDFVIAIAKRYAFLDASMLIAIDMNQGKVRIRLFGDSLPLDPLRFGKDEIKARQDEEGIMLEMEVAHG